MEMEEAIQAAMEHSIISKKYSATLSYYEDSL